MRDDSLVDTDRPHTRFSVAGMTRLLTRWCGRRPKSAKARNRGRKCTDGAAGSMGNWPLHMSWRPC